MGIDPFGQKQYQGSVVVCSLKVSGHGFHYRKPEFGIFFFDEELVELSLGILEFLGPGFGKYGTCFLYAGYG